MSGYWMLGASCSMLQCLCEKLALVVLLELAGKEVGVEVGAGVGVCVGVLVMGGAAGRVGVGGKV